MLQRQTNFNLKKKKKELEAEDEHGEKLLASNTLKGKQENTRMQIRQESIHKKIKEIKIEIQSGNDVRIISVRRG